MCPPSKAASWHLGAGCGQCWPWGESEPTGTLACKGIPLVHFVLLLVCPFAIYLSCEWFVNAVEWLGQRLNIGTMAVGTILVAFGTALPESVVTLIAVTTGKTAQAKDIGVGAAMGGPLALATVAYGVTGGCSCSTSAENEQKRWRPWAQRGTVLLPSADLAPLTDPAELRPLAKDQSWFLHLR